jgi:hypothetical protein
MIAKKADNESGIPSQIEKKTGITSDQEPGNKEQWKLYND